MRTTKHFPAIMAVALFGLLVGCAQHQLVQGDRAYERMAWADASCHYEQAMRKLDDRGIALRTAEAYRQQNNLAKAADWYAYAERMEALNPADALHYGRALHSLGRIGEAAKLYERVLVDKPEDAVVRELGLAIADHDAFYVDTTLFTVRPMHIAGATSAFSAIPVGNDILFAAEKPAEGKNINPWNGASYLDLYTSSPTATGGWSEAVPLTGDVNGRFHEGPAVISADGNTMYFTRSDYFKFRLNKDDDAVSHLMLFRAEKLADGSWGNNHSFAYNGLDFSAGHAALSKDDSTLYYISDMPGGFGGTDIYACARTPEGWGYPRNLGPSVNTSANEMFPTVHGDTLYFSSNGHRTLGGLDIFRTALINGAWTAPENLNYPINSPFDDFGLVLLPSGTDGYLSSNRHGADRIYSFEAHEPTLALTGVLLDEEEGTPMADVEVKLLEMAEADTIVQFTNDDGHFSFPLKPGRDYRVLGGKDGMFTESRDISTRDQRTSRTYTEDFELKRVVIDKPMVVENIYYDYDKWDIRPDAAIELDKLVRLFNDNPELSFELGSHTDSRATDLYNLVLSEARANSAVDYLIRNGVGSNRITARGYGEKHPVNHCVNDVECTEEEHQANRRTEFKVTRSQALLP
ncbi:MAG: OmpA family protein [Flavobacteriales bacterium]|nr:OmpA family protein [Flavobacteriales bacterium]